MPPRRPLSTSINPLTIDQIHTEARARNIDLSRRQLEAILADTDHDVVEAWVRDCLSPNVLLTTEEVELYNHISQNRPHSLAKTSRHDDGLDPTPPLHSRDIHSLTASIGTSTADIKAQTRVLQAQQRSLQSLAKLRGKGEREELKETERLKRKRVVEIQGLKFKIDDLRSELSSTLKKYQEDIIPSGLQVVFDLATKTLQQNDRTLEHLDSNPSLHFSFLATNNNTDADVAVLERINKLTGLLASYIREEITCRLDVIYLQHLLSSPPSSSLSKPSSPSIPSSPPSETEAEAEAESEQEIIEDLNSLHAEIPTVTALYVSAAFTEPLRRVLRQRQRQSKGESQVRHDEIADTLTQMEGRLEELAKKVEGLRGGQQTMSIIGKAFTETQDDASAFHDEATTTSHTREARGPKNEHLGALLSYLGLPNITSSSPARALPRALHSRLHRTQAQLASPEVRTDIYGPIRQSIEALRSAEESLVTALDHADRGGGKGTAEEEMKELGSRVGEVGRGIEEAVSWQQMGLQGPEVVKARNKFVGRWGGGGDGARIG